MAFNEVLVAKRDLLKLHRELKALIMDPEPLEHRIGNALHELRTRIVILIHPVPEAHETGGIILALDLLHEHSRILTRLSKVVEHVHDARVSAAVRRPRQGRNAGRDRGEEVRSRRADEAHRGRRAVLLMIGVENK